MKKILLIGFLFITAALSAQNDAMYISQSDIEVINAGESFNFSITFKNVGSTTWTSGSLYSLGTQAKQDNKDWLLSTNRVQLPNDVSPNQEVTFSMSLTAPVVEGVFVIQWQMVQDGVEWFGEKSEIIPFVNYSTPNAIFTYTRNPNVSSVESYDESLIVSCFQGIMNREEPLVYVLE